MRPSLVAVLDDVWLSEGMLAFSQQLQLDIGDGFRCGLRSGPTDDGNYLLDLDNYGESGALWTLERVMDEFDKLNARGVAVFQSMISAEMLGNLRGDEVPEGGQDE
ncbi:hypothetical protein GCM10025788_26460 [Serinicoccus chungangensis]